MSKKMEYTFDTFTVSDSNQFAYAASVAVAQSLGEVYNPLLLIGESGSGKSHLLQAICNFAKSSTPKIKALIEEGSKLETELFAEMGATLDRQKIATLKERFHMYDMILIDDIDVFMKQDSTRTDFFDLLRDICDQKKQVVLTSKKGYVKLSEFEKQYHDAFGEWALVAELSER